MRKPFLLLLLVALLTTLSTHAYDFQSGDLYYYITSDTTVVATYQEDGSESNYQGLTTATIPATVTYNGTTYSVTSIGNGALRVCTSLTSITIPNSVTRIGDEAFNRCNKLKNVVIGNKTYEQQTIVNDKCKAYKAFKVDLTCRDFQYEEGKTYEIDGEPELCKQGFHACLNLLDVFNYYNGEIGKDIVVHEVELDGVSEERNDDDSKVVAKKITIGKRIL